MAQARRGTITPPMAADLFPSWTAINLVADQTESRVRCGGSPLSKRVVFYVRVQFYFDILLMMFCHCVNKLNQNPLGKYEPDG